MWTMIRDSCLFHGSCHCEMYVSAEELCNSSCLSALPVLSARLTPNGQLVLRIKMMDENRIRSRVSNVYLCMLFFFSPPYSANFSPVLSARCINQLSFLFLEYEEHTGAWQSYQPLRKDPLCPVFFWWTVWLDFKGSCVYWLIFIW